MNTVYSCATYVKKGNYNSRGISFPSSTYIKIHTALFLWDQSYQKQWCLQNMINIFCSLSFKVLDLCFFLRFGLEGLSGCTLTHTHLHVTLFLDFDVLRKGNLDWGKKQQETKLLKVLKSSIKAWIPEILLYGTTWKHKVQTDFDRTWIYLL